MEEEDIDIEAELKKQTQHDQQSMRNAIKATSLFRYHSLIIENSSYKFSSRLGCDENISLFNDVLGCLCEGSPVSEAVLRLLKAPGDEKFIYIATLAKLRGCGGVLVEHGLETLIHALYTKSPNVKESAASALAALSYYPVGVEQLLIEHHEDSMLVETITELSLHIPLCDTFLKGRDASTVRDHRRRQLRKTSSNGVSKLPDIGTNTIYNEKTRLKTPARVREGKKTPAPGDKSMAKMDTVLYREITNMGLSRPYSKVGTLPPLLLSKSLDQPASTSHDRSLYTTVDRVYRKLYLRANTQGGQRPVTSQPPTNRQGLARSLSFAF